MLKLLPQYSCWRVGRGHWFVIVSDAKTGYAEYYKVTENGCIVRYPSESIPQDVRLYYPCKWQALPPVLRARLRQIVALHFLAEHPELSSQVAYDSNWVAR